ncbi:MAG: hypothetical protein CMP10_05220 [Zetaproteobacteria bacterium]|nr:hypothetical protein [Pseudobdellovibrionaceae bacterium]|tara:strand:- start:75 stop:683 length:609 start_codon:yes stop_codon:yes gene_type:complete
MKTEPCPTRKIILDKALGLFAEKGFHGTSIREISSTVGITKSSIYSHFLNKEKILEALLTESGPGAMNQQFCERWKNLEGKPLSTVLNEVFQELMERWYDPNDHKILNMVIIEQFKNKNIRDYLNQELFLQERNHFAGMFEYYAAKNINPDLDPVELAEELLSFAVWIRAEFFIFAETPPPRDFIEKKVSRKIERLCRYMEL